MNWKNRLIRLAATGAFVFAAAMLFHANGAFAAELQSDEALSAEAAAGTGLQDAGTGTEQTEADLADDEHPDSSDFTGDTGADAEEDVLQDSTEEAETDTGLTDVGTAEPEYADVENTSEAVSSEEMWETAVPDAQTSGAGMQTGEKEAAVKTVVQTESAAPKMAAANKEPVYQIKSSRCYDDKGNLVKNKIVKVNGKYYYADNNGKIAVWKLLNISGTKYFAHLTGALVINDFMNVTENGKTNRYYFGADGRAMQNGVFTVTGNQAGKYYADRKTAVIPVMALVKDGSEKYYAHARGKLVQNDFMNVVEGGKTNRYYFGADGKAMHNGVFTVTGKQAGKYYADKKTAVIPVMALVKDGNEKYYAHARGKLVQNDFMNVVESGKTNRYYFGADGKAVHNGIFTINGGVHKGMYYADKTTAVVPVMKLLTVNGDKYYAHQKGKLVQNDFMNVTENGQPNRYYFGTDGKGMLVNKLSGSKGIDVSFFNGTIDWKKVAADGIRFAFVRAGGRYMKTGEIYYDDHSAKNNNTVFRANVSGALENGIQVGAYFYTQAINQKEALEEADFLMKQVASYGSKITLPLIIDTEYGGRHSEISTAQRTAVVKAFCDRVASKGYNAGIYASKSWLENQLDMSKLSKYAVWVAQYPYDSKNSTVSFDKAKGSSTKYAGSYVCWQFSAKGKVNGINGKVDVNLWH